MRNRSRLPGGKQCWGKGLSADNESSMFEAWVFEGACLQVCKTQPWYKLMITSHVQVGLVKRISTDLSCKAFLDWLNFQE